MKKTSSDNIRVLKTETCNSLSGKSKITYHIGCTPDFKIYFRISTNTGGGFFSQEWVSWNDILDALKKCPSGTPISSIFLYKLYTGKSVNTPSFLLAALKHLKLVQPIKDKKRCHELLDSKPFMDDIKKLMATKVAVNAGKKTTTKKAVSKKVSKKTSPSKKKTAPKK